MHYSPSSINTYLRNPIDFFERYVLGLQEQDDLLDEPDARQVGTFIHGVLEDVFSPLFAKKNQFFNKTMHGTVLAN